jgi:hypothetical protein
MTLILGMSKAEGIYLSTDYRVTDARSGKPVDDASIKFLTVTYPPDKTGPRALLGYSGLAILPDGTSTGTPTGAWIRETLRGENQVFDASMAHLRERLDRDIGPLRVGLQITVLVTQGDRRYFGGFSNLMAPARPFGYQMKEMHEPFAFAHGSGTPRVLKSADVGLLESQLQVAPRKPLDHMRLLATVNRRAAAREPTVSPFCHVAFVNADERTSPMSQNFLEHGEGVPFAMPVLIFGIDLFGLSQRFHEQSQAFFRGEDSGELDLDAAEINEELKRRS